jgi:hypothetical protein
VVEPLECSECQSIFCSDCIEIWNYTKDCCPKKCLNDQAVEWRKMHRIMKTDMVNLKFKCRNIGCEKVNPYKEAMDHIRDCDKAMKPCRYNCGLGILKSDMEFHI